MRDLKSIMLAMSASVDEIRALDDARYEQAKTNPTCFTYWFPVVEKLRIRTPKSLVIPFPREIIKLIQQDCVDESLTSIKPIADQMRAFAVEVGYPLFIKNSLFSGKHSWGETCFVQSEKVSIEDHIAYIFYLWAMHSPEYALHVVAREFIRTTPAFHAFGGMPVTQEYRLFVRDGKVEGYQFYWPESSIMEPSVPDWRDRLRAISKPAPHLLAEMIADAEHVGRELGDYWSVDFLMDQEGSPWLIDMAEGDKSYRCPTGYRSL